MFAEPITDLALSRARTTADQAAAHNAIGFAAGGEPGSLPVGREVRYYISSRRGSGKMFLGASRRHWGIENAQPDNW